MLAEIPVWSRRLMEDRLRLASTRDERLAAVRAHRDRMKTLERTAEGYAKTGRGRVSDALKVAYYRLEAEQLLVEAGGDVGQVVRPPLPAAPQTPPLTPQGSPR